MTYPLYLLHQNVGYVVVDAMRRHVTDTVALFVSVGVCLGLAFVVTGLPNHR